MSVVGNVDFGDNLFIILSKIATPISLLEGYISLNLMDIVDLVRDL